MKKDAHIAQGRRSQLPTQCPHFRGELYRGVAKPYDQITSAEITAKQHVATLLDSINERFEIQIDKPILTYNDLRAIAINSFMQVAHCYVDDTCLDPSSALIRAMRAHDKLPPENRYFQNIIARAFEYKSTKAAIKLKTSSHLFVEGLLRGSSDALFEGFATCLAIIDMSARKTGELLPSLPLSELVSTALVTARRAYGMVSELSGVSKLFDSALHSELSAEHGVSTHYSIRFNDEHFCINSESMRLELVPDVAEHMSTIADTTNTSDWLGCPSYQWGTLHSIYGKLLVAVHDSGLLEQSIKDGVHTHYRLLGSTLVQHGGSHSSE